MIRKMGVYSVVFFTVEVRFLQLLFVFFLIPEQN